MLLKKSGVHSEGSAGRNTRSSPTAGRLSGEQQQKVQSRYSFQPSRIEPVGTYLWLLPQISVTTFLGATFIQCVCTLLSASSAHCSALRCFFTSIISLRLATKRSLSNTIQRAPVLYIFNIQRADNATRAAQWRKISTDMTAHEIPAQTCRSRLSSGTFSNFPKAWLFFHLFCKT